MQGQIGPAITGACGASVVFPDIRPIPAKPTKLNIVNMRRIAILENEHQFVTGTVHGPHTTVRFDPNTEVQLLAEILPADTFKNANVAPVDEDVMDGAI